MLPGDLGRRRLASLRMHAGGGALSGRHPGARAAQPLEQLEGVTGGSNGQASLGGMAGSKEADRRGRAEEACAGLQRPCMRTRNAGLAGHRVLRGGSATRAYMTMPRDVVDSSCALLAGLQEPLACIEREEGGDEFVSASSHACGRLRIALFVVQHPTVHPLQALL